MWFDQALAASRIARCAFPSATGFRGLVRPNSVTRVPSRSCFFEWDRKGGDYARPDPRSRITILRDGFKELGSEVRLFKDELVDQLTCDPKLYYDGDTEVFWKFDTEASVNDWVVTSDSDNNEGFSSAQFFLGSGNTGVFTGYLDNRTPKDGKVLHTGYCNIRSPKAVKSFQRISYYDWSAFSHLQMRVRGDGRTYMINIGMDGFLDLTWNVIYNYALFTRGGPYWQSVKIPFSKFFLSNKGRVQDKQGPLPRTQIRSLGFTCADGVSGPFRLEIDFIGGFVDESHVEEFAYEMYETPKHYVPGY